MLNDLFAFLAAMTDVSDCVAAIRRRLDHFGGIIAILEGESVDVPAPIQEAEDFGVFLLERIPQHETPMDAVEFLRVQEPRWMELNDAADAAVVKLFDVINHAIGGTLELLPGGRICGCGQCGLRDGAPTPDATDLN